MIQFFEQNFQFSHFKIVHQNEWPFRKIKLAALALCFDFRESNSFEILISVFNDELTQFSQLEIMCE